MAADFVLLLTGYLPASELLVQAGVEIDAASRIPRYDTKSYETNVPGLYVIGSAACGCETGTIFIENGRLHARAAVTQISMLLGSQSSS